jgi:paraquat-inducible protein A
MPTIKEDELVECHICKAMNLAHTPNGKCRRCQTTLHTNPHLSTQKSWAYLITAMIAFIPANLYPMLITKQFGVLESSTILGGVIMLWEHGSYPIAMIIFFASIVIPLLKFSILFYLLISVKYPLGKDKALKKKRLYTLTEMIGPWSMIDVFVVAILSALIQLNNVSILAGTASTAFALSVFFTLLAAHAFDTRLIKETLTHD